MAEESLLSALLHPGTKHKLTLEGHSVLPRRRGKVAASRASCKSKRLASKGSVGVASKSFQCEVCEIAVNSETQLSQVGGAVSGVESQRRFYAAAARLLVLQLNENNAR